MNISPLYEILVFIEDRKSVLAADISLHNKNQVRGVLGKMEAMKLVKKTESQYSLSKTGQDFLNSVLDVLHKSTLHWDEKWRFIGFSISEKNRSKRDKFRRELEGLGLKPYLNSFWITPLNLNEKIMLKAKELSIEKDIIILESNQIIGRSNDELIEAWDFESSRAQLEDFIKESELLIRSKDKSPFDIKLCIFKYALILNSQPQLPIELLPKDWPQFRANLQYKRVRRLIAK